MLRRGIGRGLAGRCGQLDHHYNRLFVILIYSVASECVFDCCGRGAHGGTIENRLDGHC
jgi:hypothetical protein